MAMISVVMTKMDSIVMVIINQEKNVIRKVTTLMVMIKMVLTEMDAINLVVNEITKALTIKDLIKTDTIVKATIKMATIAEV